MGLKDLKIKSVGSGKIFAVVAGQRLAGKSTLAGTLPGKTILISPALQEAGSGSASAMAKEQGSKLDVYTFDSLSEDGDYPSLDTLLNAVKDDKEYDNVYIDGLSAISNMIHDEPAMQAALKKDVWGAYREIAKRFRLYINEIKGLTLSKTNPKNVYATMALIEKYDSLGNIIDVNFDAKGNVAVTEITQKVGIIVVVKDFGIEKDGKYIPDRKLITKTYQKLPARIDSLLDKDNPGILNTDLKLIIKLTKGV